MASDKQSPYEESKELDEGRVWLQEVGKQAVLGLTQLGLGEVGEVESVDLMDRDSFVEEGDVIATIDGSDGSFELAAPFAGKIEEVNRKLKRNPNLMNEDPTEQGWLVKIGIEASEEDDDDDEEDDLIDDDEDEEDED